ncbi:MAG TPA: hypothetical protein VNZ01_05220 [Solirubrobacteraceae bacterium]|jgi:hypothetical protein|nr:hypothetical protein [Solirubrobacteraceae bacterium]
MSGARSRYGLLVSALGAILLAVSVFLPWYGLSFTSTGIAFVQHVTDQLASQFGNASLQAYLGAQHASLSALAGHEFTAVSAHQALKNINVVLLVLACLAMLDALIPLASGGSSVPDGGGAAIVLLGALASMCVVYRIVSPPTPAGELVALSLREGAWLALLGSLAILAGGLWPRGRAAENGSPQTSIDTAWTGLSGWTPQG